MMPLRAKITNAERRVAVSTTFDSLRTASKSINALSLEQLLLGIVSMFGKDGLRSNESLKA